MNNTLTRNENRLTIEDIKNLYTSGIKASNDMKIGIEYERLPIETKTGQAASYYSQNGICEFLREFAKEDCVVAIGECGLDYNRNYSPQDVQRKWFEEQVKLAEELDMPLFLHEREAHEDLVKILEKYPNMCEKACVHCFTGTKEEAKKYLELGCSIGVTGWICDERRGQSLQEAVTVIPPEKMMIETDAPFLIPRNFPKKPKSNKNKPEYLPHILNTIAEYKGMDSEELGKKVSETTRKFFNI